MMQTKNEMLESRTEAVSRDALVRAALQEITQNYREASLSNVARAYGVSLAYVSECVRAQTGKTYKELLQRHRMETAARLLRRSDLNIQQIIAQVGYENTSYFYRLFHERYGLSPVSTVRCAQSAAGPRPEHSRQENHFPPERGTGVRRTVPCFFAVVPMHKKLVFSGRM